VAVTDPDRAERIASGVTDELAKARAFASVAAAVAVADQDRAERIAGSIEHEPAKLWALGDVAGQARRRGPSAIPRRRDPRCPRLVVPRG
jgi:hypothetical protein